MFFSSLLGDQIGDASIEQRDDRNRIFHQVKRERMPTASLLGDQIGGASIAKQDDRNRGAKTRIVQKLLCEGQLGWTVLELSKESGFPQMELQRILTALYDSGRVAYLLDSKSMTRTWFDIPRVLGMAIGSGSDVADPNQPERKRRRYLRGYLCAATGPDGSACEFKVISGSIYCGHHQAADAIRKPGV